MSTCLALSVFAFEVSEFCTGCGCETFIKLHDLWIFSPPVGHTSNCWSFPSLHWSVVLWQGPVRLVFTSFLVLCHIKNSLPTPTPRSFSSLFSLSLNVFHRFCTDFCMCILHVWDLVFPEAFGEETFLSPLCLADTLSRIRCIFTGLFQDFVLFHWLIDTSPFTSSPRCFILQVGSTLFWYLVLNPRPWSP